MVLNFFFEFMRSTHFFGGGVFSVASAWWRLCSINLLSHGFAAIQRSNQLHPQLALSISCLFKELLFALEFEMGVDLHCCKSQLLDMFIDKSYIFSQSVGTYLLGKRVCNSSLPLESSLLSHLQFCLQWSFAITPTILHTSWKNMFLTKSSVQIRCAKQICMAWMMV